ncbi:hypothetical protein C8F04DRAFT_1261083 [Mycena alexandri]|uniref:Uncharacterized protein n=1 Tax=Mycena alexandri TaxID=1745969 RepID=A0AAD6SST8_9AGAR|nr:hypothetical protein C8F04DRAFT_1261083 [Mycena alexandri]
MSRQTRSGKQFSPFESFLPVDPSNIDPSRFQIHRMDVSLEELFAAAEEAAENRAQAFEDAVIDPEDSGNEWEEIESRPPTPTMDSPSPTEPAGVDEELTEELTTPTQATPALSAAERQRLRKAQYNKKRRQDKRQQSASSPFTRTAHPKSLPTHRMLPPHNSTFDALDFQTTNGGAWLGRRQGEPTSKKGSKKAKKAAPTERRRHMPTAEELVNEMEYKYLCWDGKKPLLILDQYGRIIVAFAGAPEDPEWASVGKKALNAMKEAWEEGFRRGDFTLDDETHRRGTTFVPLTGGVSYGGGQQAH